MASHSREVVNTNTLSLFSSSKETAEEESVAVIYYQTPLFSCLPRLVPPSVTHSERQLCTTLWNTTSVVVGRSRFLLAQLLKWVVFTASLFPVDHDRFGVTV